MPSFRIIVVFFVFLLALGGVAYAASDWLKGNAEQKFKTLADIQPGLGTVMIEYSHRYSTMYYAAKAGNWPLAAYELKEALEIQEVGGTTRPEKADALKAFERSFLTTIDKAIKAQDFKRFDAAFKAGIQGCNACHTAQKMPFIKYQLPDNSPSPLTLKPLRH